MTKEAYKLLAKKHDLPDFKVLDNIFEVSELETKFPLRDIRRHMTERLKSNADIVEEIIYPNSTVSAHHEIRFFDETDKRKVYDIYANLMKLIRRSHAMDLQQDDTLDASYIKFVCDNWSAIQKPLHLIMKKLEKSWSVHDVLEVENSYFG